MAKKKKSSTLVYKSVPQTLVSHVSSHINAFDSESEGKKIHDGNQSNSFTLQSRTLHSLTLNDGGNGYVEISPFLVGELNGYSPATFDGTGGMSSNGILGSSISSFASNATLSDEISDAATRFRIVSYTIKIVCTQAPLDAQGLVQIKEVAETQLQSDNNVGKFGDNNWVGALNHNLNILVCPNFNSENQFVYQRPQTYYNNIVGSSSAMLPTKLIAITVTGGKTGTNGLPVLSIEVCKNLELIPEMTSISRVMCSPAAVDHYPVRQAINNTRAKLPLVHQSRSFVGRVKALAGQALHGLGNLAIGAAGRAMHAYLVSGANLPLAIANGAMNAVEVN